MSLADIVRRGVATANRVTKSLHVDVVHKAWTGQTPWGEPTYATQSTGADGGPLKALVELKQSLRALPNGTTVMTKAKVTFMEPVPVNGAAGRTEPIDPRDFIELPNGISGPIVDVAGLLDPGTNEPYMTEVWLGES
jgi:hypothetical protein